MLGLLLAMPGAASIWGVASAALSLLLRCKPCLIVLAAGALWVAGDIHGHNKSDATCEAASLQAQLAARNADIEAARKAVADAALRTASIKRDADDANRRADDYAEQLAKRPVPACNLTDDDLRGMQHGTARRRR